MQSRTAFLITAVLLILDQVTKYVAKAVDPRTGLFNFVENTGATLGLLQGSNSFLVVLSVFAALLLIVGVAKTVNPDRIGYAIVLAGVLGNLLDRIILGAVTDFIRFFNLFIFNLADVYITFAVVFLLLLELPWFRDYF